MQENWKEDLCRLEVKTKAAGGMNKDWWKASITVVIALHWRMLLLEARGLLHAHDCFGVGMSAGIECVPFDLTCGSIRLLENACRPSSVFGLSSKEVLHITYGLYNNTSSCYGCCSFLGQMGETIR